MTLKIQMPTEPSTTVARKTVGSLRRQLLLATVSVLLLIRPLKVESNQSSVFSNQ